MSSLVAPSQNLNSIHDVYSASDMEFMKSVLLAVLSKADTMQYKGYSKFDGLLSPLTTALSLGFWPFRLICTQVVMRSSINLRPLLLIKKSVNPESPALFARANLDLISSGMAGPFENRARKCLDWLLDNTSNHTGNYSGNCWGYHHPWQSPGFYQPPGFPNCYLTIICAEALFHGYQVLNEKKYLKAAIKAVDFLLNDLPVLHESPSEKCIAYVPVMHSKMRVININALTAAFLAKIGMETSSDELLKQAGKLFTFVVKKQTDYGAWFYTTTPDRDLISHDNYHTGMILDCLLDYEIATKDKKFKPAYEKGLKFYQQKLFLRNGAPKWTSNKTRPHDIHGCAQGILTFSRANDIDRACLIAGWAINKMYLGNGDFFYQTGGVIPKKFTLMHWCNGWMARGLSKLMLQLS